MDGIDYTMSRLQLPEKCFQKGFLSKIGDRGHLNIPWPIPDEMGGQKYNIFATDRIHEWEIDIPITLKINN
ncbi:MAG: hypothetical protein OEM28_02695 [Nitrosopumilus sp.]|nr:hypothetical protein [Nitrosopumilus sp.]